MKKELPDTKKKTIYLPIDIDERLQDVARKHRRSFNGELVWALQHYLEEVEKGQSHKVVKEE